MDLDKLTQGDRLLIWERFQEEPGWLLLKKELRKKKGKAPLVTDADSREAFYFAAIRNQVIDELLALPDELAEHIKRVSKQEKL